jgi:hypothetical protein
LPLVLEVLVEVSDLLFGHTEAVQLNGIIIVHLAHNNGAIVELLVGLSVVCAHVKAVMLDALHRGRMAC